MEKFFLDLATILQNFHQNGELHADLPAKKLGNRAPWKAQVRVSQDVVTSCQITNERGVVIHSGEGALDILCKLGPLNWEVVPDLLDGSGILPNANPRRTSDSLPPLSPEPGSLPDVSLTPYRLMNITLKQMNQTQWPRDYRLVYILVDGTRTTEKIASMLAMSLDDVEHVLKDLQGMRIIDFQP